MAHVLRPADEESTKRLTSTYFMERYRKFLKDGGTIHVKTDSNFMFTYTKYMIEKNGLPVEFITDDSTTPDWWMIFSASVPITNSSGWTAA